MNHQYIKQFSAVMLGLFLLGMTNVFGQTPEKVTLNSKDYYQHGFNSNGTNTFDGTGKAVVKAEEATDSVTISSTMNYFVLPDRAFNPNWFNGDGTIKNITNTSDLSSTFTWTINTTAGGAGTTASTTPIAPINWTALGTANIVVKENPTTAACAGSETTIPVQIIRKPTITFGQIASAYTDQACYQQAAVTAGIEYQFPVTVATDVKAPAVVKVDYTVTKDGTLMPALAGTDVTIVGGNLTNAVKFTDYGVYVITITKVTDRIARKSGVASTTDLLTAGGSASFTYTVVKPVQTGPVFHLPNNGIY